MPDFDSMNVGGNIGEGVGDLIGGLIAEAIAKGDYDEAARLRGLAQHAYDNVAMPGNPQALGDSALAGATNDPRVQQAQRSRQMALERLQQIGLEGGMDAESRAALADAGQQAAQFDNSRRGAMMQQQQARGLNNSNLTMAQQMLSQQGASDRMAQAGVQAAGDARSRALQALSRSGDMAGGIEHDAYGEVSDLADRRDAIARFNTDTANEYAQRRFANNMALTDRRAGMYQDQADEAKQRGDRTVEKGRGYGRTIGRVGGSIVPLL